MLPGLKETNFEGETTHSGSQIQSDGDAQMLRTIMVCVLIGGAATGCASLGSGSTAANYSLTGGGGACSPREGGGDCQPCPISADNTRSLSTGSPVDRNRTP